MSLPVPPIHLNGSGAKSLIKQAADAYAALQDAMQAMRIATPHGRDYYTDPDPEAYVRARNAHSSNMLLVEKVAQDFLDFAITLQRL